MDFEHSVNPDENTGTKRVHFCDEILEKEKGNGRSTIWTVIPLTDAETQITSDNDNDFDKSDPTMKTEGPTSLPYVEITKYPPSHLTKEHYLCKIPEMFLLKPKIILIKRLVLGFLAFVFILSFLVTIWPTCEVKKELRGCETIGCLDASIKILSSVNLTQDPCEDFREFSCGKWLQNNPIPESKAFWSYESDKMLKAKKTMVYLIHKREKLDSVDIKVKDFYDSCMNPETMERLGSSPLLITIRELGGWEPLKNFKIEDFDFQHTLTKTHKEYRASPFFKIDVVADPQFSTKHIIRISPGGLSIPRQFYLEETPGHVATKFKAFVKDIIQLLGGTTFWANIGSTEIFDYETKIAQALNFSETIAKKIRVDELNKMSRMIFWEDFLRALYPKAVIADDTEILVTSVDYLNEISAIILSSEKTTLNTYLIWHLVNQYLRHLSKEFRLPHEKFLTELTGRKSLPPRWEFCMDETIKVFSPVLNTWLRDDCEQRIEKISKGEEIFKLLIDSFTNRIKSSPEIPTDFKVRAIQKVASLKLQVGSVPIGKNYLVEMYTSLDILKNEFLVNSFEVKLFLLQVQGMDLEPMIEKRDGYLPYSSLYLNGNNFKPHFNPIKNLIVFPETELYSDELLNAPTEIFFGKTGVGIAEAIVESLEFGLKFDFQVDNESTRDDFSKLFQNLVTPRSISLVKHFQSTNQRTTMMTYFMAVEISRNALSEVTKVKAKPYKFLPLLKQFNSKQTFYISYGMTQCSEMTEKYMDTIGYFKEKERMNYISKESENFSAAFGCFRKKDPSNK